jgi:asparagine synthase (glutamine-hydrolysing)
MSYYTALPNKIFYDRSVIVARDAYGIRPMFIAENKDYTFGVSSVLKQLTPLTQAKVRQFEPGTYRHYFYNNGLIAANAQYDFKSELLFSKANPLNNDNMAAVCFNVNRLLNEAVKMRVDNTDRQVACLLSGGLDSSLITALVAKYVPDPKQLNTFSIGMAGASDLGYAQKVATHLGTNHHEIIVSEEDFFEAIPIVIKAIESYDTTTVRASVGNYLIGKYISENCDAKVIFNGDGSDELFGGYLYMHCAPSSEEFDEETKRLLDNIHYFDVLRSDRCISCHGLEPRTPFMDINLIAYYLSVPCNLRNHRDGKKLPEKYILRKAFSQDNQLTESVLWRTKEAFSDGVSNEENSWHTIIKRRLNGHKKEIMEFSNYDPKLSLEQNYYKQIFNVCYGGNEHVIPYYWMPKFTNATDCSARSLGIYKELQ